MNHLITVNRQDETNIRWKKVLNTYLRVSGILRRAVTLDT